MKNMLTVKEARLTEWSLGNTYTVADRFLQAVTKRTGLKFNLSPYAENVQNEYGKFIVYRAGMTGNKLIDLSFSLNKSAEFHSIDLFLNSMTPIAWRRLDLNGFNVVKVFDQVVSFLKGHYDGTEQLDEALTTKGKVPTWDFVMADLFEKDPSFVQAMVNSNGPDVAYIVDAMNKAMKAGGGNKQVDPAGVPLRVKKYFVVHGMAAKAVNVPVATVTAAPRKNVVFADPVDQAAYDATFVESSPFIQMEDFKYDVTRICKGDPSINGLVAYGKAGVGKDHWVDEILKEWATPFVKPSTKTGGKSGFYEFCYANKDNVVIVFSDYDDIWKNTAEVNLLKLALEDKVTRHLDYGGAEKTALDGSKIPAEGYDFTSKIIFLSNMATLGDDPAFSAHRSRMSVYALLFTDREVLDMIKGAIDKITAAGDAVVPVEQKMEVWDYLARMMDIAGAQGHADVFTVDFRRFRRALRHRFCCPPDNMDWWKRMALKEFK